MSDLIDRETLRIAMYHEAFEKDSDEQRWDRGCWVRYKMFERVLASVTSVEPEKWIPLRTRPMDEDERKEWSEKVGYKLEDYEAVIYTGPLPDHGQDVLICLRSGNIRIDTFEEDDCGCYFDEYGEMDGVVAWMPLPQPWRGEE